MFTKTTLEVMAEALIDRDIELQRRIESRSPTTVRLRPHLKADLAKVRAALKELGTVFDWRGEPRAHHVATEEEEEETV